MNKKVSIVVTALLACVAVNGYANGGLKRGMVSIFTGPQGAIRQVKELGLGDSFAFALRNRIASVHVQPIGTKYISSGQLFLKVKDTGKLQHLSKEQLRELETKFSKLDDYAATQPHKSYAAALKSMDPAADPQVLNNPDVRDMLDLLSIQQYMQLPGNQFPSLYTISEGGWLTVTPCFESVEGNQAFLGVVSILVKEKLGTVSPAVVKQLVDLYTQAANKTSMTDLANQLEEWRLANNSKDAPKLPTDLDGISLRSNSGNLWLAVEIRLRQLQGEKYAILPDDIPEIIRTAKVAD